MEEIARRLGLKAMFVDTHWETILQEMQSGRYDCIVGGITITPERATARQPGGCKGGRAAPTHRKETPLDIMPPDSAHHFNISSCEAEIRSA